MPRYKIEELSFIDNQLVQAGSEIETDTLPGTHWTPLDKKAEKASAEAEAAEAERVAALKAQQDQLNLAQSIVDNSALV